VAHHPAGRGRLTRGGPKIPSAPAADLGQGGRQAPRRAARGPPGAVCRSL